MSRYTIESNDCASAVVDTTRAAASWNEATRWDGNNNVSVATGSQWAHETLYRSAKGRYYVEHTSQWQGISPYAQFISGGEAARWLLANEKELPNDLARFENEVSE